MPSPKPRLNAYAETIPPLVDVSQESMATSPANVQAMGDFLVLLRGFWPSVLRRGWYGKISVEILIRDGIIEEDVQVMQRRTYRLGD